MKLIIAEKKDFAKKIANSIGNSHEERGFYETDNYHISWTWGHVLSLAEPEEYDSKYATWDLDDLPIIPKKYQYEKVGKHQQLELINELIKRYPYEEIICATDAEREGELIFRLLYNHLGKPLPATRMWCNTTNKDGILKALNERKDISEYDGYYHEADAREKADWLIGMNLSRLYTKKFHFKFPLGRVITPTMCLICERQKEIDNFVPEDILTVRGEYEDLVFKRVCETEEEAQILLNKNNFIVEKLKISLKTVKAPRLFKLSTLQQEANRLFGYSLSESLEIVQTLYQKEIVSYPRTNSEFLPEDLKDEYDKLISSILPSYNITLDEINTKPLFNNEKIDDHFALIIIDNEKKDFLSQDELNIYELIETRMILSAMDDYEYEEKAYELDDGFQGIVKKTRQEGFVALSKTIDDKYNYQESCSLEEDNTFTAKVELIKTKTKPKSPYTDASIVRKMENLKDKEYGYANGIGTPATRDSVIEKLIEHEYIIRKKKQLLPTKKAEILYDLLSPNIRSVELTAHMEHYLNNIRENAVQKDEFLTVIEKYIQSEIDRINRFDDLVFEICSCPFCDKKVILEGKKYHCQNNSCSFEVWVNNGFLKSLGIKESEVNDAFIKKLCSEDGITLRNLKSKKGNTYHLKIFPIEKEDRTNFRTEYVK